MESRRNFVKKNLFALAACGLGADSLSAKQGGRSNKPNIIYILADDLGYGELGCYGQKLIETPNIDRMAEEGLRLMNHYSGSALCAPSRCVLMTGLHTGHCYVRNNFRLPFEGNVPIPPDSQTIPKLLKRAGYATGAFGKWGLGYPGSHGDPVNQGFDYFYGYNCQRQAHSYYPKHLWRNRKKDMLAGNTKRPFTDYSHDLLTEEALDFIRRHEDEPFFLYLPYTIPHTKFQVPELGEYADKPWSGNQKTQAAMISRMDRDVGRIIKLIEQLGLDRNTLIIFTSDNGPHGAGGTIPRFDGNGPFRGKKSSLYDGGVHVPFVARWPGSIEPGRVSEHISAFQDMLPTFAEMAGVEPEKHTDGISILPTLLGRGKQREHDYLYWELGRKRAVRKGKWKAVVKRFDNARDARIELYRIEDDVGEDNDLADQYPEVVERMRKIFAEAHEDGEFYHLKQSDFIDKN